MGVETIPKEYTSDLSKRSQPSDGGFPSFQRTFFGSGTLGSAWFVFEELMLPQTSAGLDATLKFLWTKVTFRRMRHVLPG